jgi:thiosulfate reductase/polysulfide reductase chain A
LAAGKADTWLPIRPGTDMALILAWINIIISEGWYDKEYLDTYASGFDELAAAVKEYTPEWAARETDLPADTIVAVARELGRNRPAVCIHPGRHVTWDGKDVQRQRALAILTALLGSWGRKGGIYLANRAELPKAPAPKFPKPGREPLNKGNYPFAGPEGLTTAIREATITGKPYPIKAWLMTGTNLLASLPDQRQTRAAIDKLDFFVAVDVMPMDTVMLADVILPECSYLERHDAVAVSRGMKTTISLRQPVVEPLHESKPAWWIARELAHRLDLGAYYPWQSYEEKIKGQCRLWGVSYEELKRDGVVTLPTPATPYISADVDPVFHTPSATIELASEQLKEKGFDAVPRYQKNRQPGPGQFRLLYGRSPVHTFSRTVNNQLLNELFSENEVWLSARRAAELGFAHGDHVVLVNEDGVRSNRLRLKVTERIRHDCVYMVHGFGSGSKHLTRAFRRGGDDQGLITRYATDPIAGTTGMRIAFVTIEREA